MAITVTVTFDRTDVQSGQKVAGLVAVANTGAAPVTVSNLVVGASKPNLPVSVVPLFNFTGTGAGGGTANPATPPYVVNNGGTVYFPFEVVGHAQVTPGSGSSPMEIEAIVFFSDGTNAQAKAGFSVTAAPGVGEVQAVKNLNLQSAAQSGLNLIILGI